MHQSIMTKIKNSASEDWIVTEKIVKHSIKIFFSVHRWTEQVVYSNLYGLNLFLKRI